MCVHYDKVMQTSDLLLSCLFLTHCFHLLTLSHFILNHNCSQNTTSTLNKIFRLFKSLKVSVSLQLNLLNWMTNWNAEQKKTNLSIYFLDEKKIISGQSVHGDGSAYFIKTDIKTKNNWQTGAKIVIVEQWIIYHRNVSYERRLHKTLPSWEHNWSSESERLPRSTADFHHLRHTAYFWWLIRGIVPLWAPRPPPGSYVFCHLKCVFFLFRFYDNSYPI